MLINQNFQIIRESLSVDANGKLILEEQAKSTVYRVFINDAGQILLDPIHIDEKERWLWENSEALASVQRGIKQAAEGKGKFLGSFAQYTDLEVED